MSFAIRKAVPEDIDRLFELIHQLAVFERQPDAVIVSRTEFYEAGFGANPVWNAFVAVSNNQIVGMSLFYIRYSTWKGRRLFLEDLIVDESVRGKGCGKLLLDKTIAYAQEKGYSGLMWQVLEWNTAAIEFYKKYNSTFDGEWLNVNLDF